MFQTAHSHVVTTPAARRAAAPAMSLAGARQNALLRALSEADLERLFGHMELVPLKAGQCLYDFGDELEYCYFQIGRAHV